MAKMHMHLDDKSFVKKARVNVQPLQAAPPVVVIEEKIVYVDKIVIQEVIKEVPGPTVYVDKIVEKVINMPPVIVEKIVEVEVENITRLRELQLQCEKLANRNKVLCCMCVLVSILATVLVAI